MLRAIVFDYGKVLSLAPSGKDWQRLADVFAVPVEKFQKSYWGLRDKYDRAEFDGPAYWAAVGEQLGKPVQNGACERLIALDNAQWTKENPQMLEFAWQAQRSGLKIGILSNMQSDMLAAMRAKLRWLDRFDAQVYTCEVGVIKPEPASYHKVLEALDERPDNAIFFDDKTANIEGALAVGMHAALFSGDVGTAYAAVEQLGVALNGKSASYVAGGRMATEPTPNSELVKVFDTEQESEAMVVKGLLDSAGIEALVTSLDAQQEILPGVGGVIVQVAPDRADEAKEIIETYRNAPATEDEIVASEGPDEA